MKRVWEVLTGFRLRHIKRGGMYREVGRGRLQTSRPLHDLHPMVAYRGEKNGEWWFRPMAEMDDGRFENISDDTLFDDDLIQADYEAVLADHRRLVRELDVLLNGAHAAQQASLCDILSQVASEGIRSKHYKETEDVDQV